MRFASLLAPEGSPFSANSMSIRAVDTFYVKDGKPLAVIKPIIRAEQYRQRVSTAVGAAQHFARTTFSPATSRCCTISPAFQRGYAPAPWAEGTPNHFSHH